MACLRAEFGPERVDSDYYKKSATSNVIKLAGLLRLSDPRLLALWFGVDDVRTPTRDTFSTILDYLQDLGVPSEDKAQAFSEWDYPDMVVKWAERARLDTSHPKDRERCVFARQTLNTHPHPARSRLVPRDLLAKRRDVPGGAATHAAPAPSPDRQLGQSPTLVDSIRVNTRGQLSREPPSLGNVVPVPVPALLHQGDAGRHPAKSPGHLVLPSERHGSSSPAERSGGPADSNTGPGILSNAAVEHGRRVKSPFSPVNQSGVSHQSMAQSTTATSGERLEAPPRTSIDPDACSMSPSRPVGTGPSGVPLHDPERHASALSHEEATALAHEQTRASLKSWFTSQSGSSFGGVPLSAFQSSSATCFAPGLHSQDDNDKTGITLVDGSGDQGRHKRPADDAVNYSAPKRSRLENLAMDSSSSAGSRLDSVTRRHLRHGPNTSLQGGQRQWSAKPVLSSSTECRPRRRSPPTPMP